MQDIERHTINDMLMEVAKRCEAQGWCFCSFVEDPNMFSYYQAGDCYKLIGHLQMHQRKLLTMAVPPEDDGADDEDDD